jgi:ubiquinone/menaquinone biosynthesis C-methylase UbiE
MGNFFFGWEGIVSLDLPLRRLAERINIKGMRPPGVVRLQWIREEIAQDLQHKILPDARALYAGLAARDPQIREQFSDLCAQTLQEFRRGVIQRAQTCDRITGHMARLDARWLDEDASEFLDDPDYHEEKRVRILRDLDNLNDLIGNYSHFYSAVQEHFAEGRTTRILDLAAGHGGFALWAARQARSEGVDLEIVATDLKPEYLDLGRQHARKRGLSVRFEVQDALNLENRLHEDYDLVICTQSLHHFPVGLIPLMYEEACRIAKRAVLFIDGHRGIAHAVPVVSLALLRYRNIGFTHDALVSFRRFFTPEELWLICSLGPHGEGTLAKWGRPSHIYLSSVTSTPARDLDS